MIRVYRLQVVVYSLIFFQFILFTVHCNLSPTYAATSTPSAKQATASASLTDKINALKKEIATRAAKLKLEVDKKIQNKAVLGKLVNKSNDRLTITKLASAAGNLARTIGINEYTQYHQGYVRGKKISLAQVTSNDLLIALGDIDDKGMLTAKTVYRLDKVTFPNNQLIWGQIQSVSGPTIVVKTKDQAQVKLLTSSASWQLGNEQASAVDAKPNRFLVSVGSSLRDNQSVSRLIYLIPSPGFIKPDKPRPATSSATPSTSPKKKNS